MKRLIFLLGILFFLAVASFSWIFVQVQPVNSDNTSKRFTINDGENASQVGVDLEKQGLIKSSIVFRIYTQVTQSAKKIRAGSYELSSNLSVPRMVNKLLAGPTEVWITIPEGYRREEIAAKAVTALELSGDTSNSFMQEFLNITIGKEGYLFPDTYLVPKDVTPTIFARMMETNFSKRVDFSYSNNDIILASIIERETKTDEERPVVAGILLKRITAGWPLQADAAIQYVTSGCKILDTTCNWWKSVTADDLNVDSPFNTYLNTGLPPSPISNPGLTSIKAATNPKDSSYWYYIHDKDGQIHYAETIEEQNANIAKYLQ
ncbi:MAG TPA: endolytic transglycosylase MltG [Candidatus Saccharimonadales bacterium]|nr:endolytic transglycosylase MltG [Candidatus Saccharimonadales bacterium]